MMPEGIARRRADRCFATLRSDQRAKNQERNYRNDVALTAFLAVSVMCLFLWFKSRHKLLLGIIVVVLLPLAMLAMPEGWKARMQTIQTYEEDGSAMGRINAWQTAINIAADRPIVGGGFELYSKETFARYAPNPEAVHSAHSIYFQMLGEHGYVGLVMFVTLGLVGWMNARKVIRMASARPEFGWASDLARAVQVSLVGYAVGGAFVNIAYWDLPYYLLVVLVIMKNLMRGPLAETSPPSGRIWTDPKKDTGNPALPMPRRS